MILQPTKSLEEVIKANHIEAFKVIAEKLASPKKRSSSKRKKSTLSLMEKKVDNLLSLSKEEILERMKKGMV